MPALHVLPCLLNRQKNVKVAISAGYSPTVSKYHGGYSRAVSIGVIGSQPGVSLFGPSFEWKPPKEQSAAALRRASAVAATALAGGAVQAPERGSRAGGGAARRSASSCFSETRSAGNMARRGSAVSGAFGSAAFASGAGVSGSGHAAGAQLQQPSQGADAGAQAADQRRQHSATPSAAAQQLSQSHSQPQHSSQEGASGDIQQSYSLTFRPGELVALRASGHQGSSGGAPGQSPHTPDHDPFVSFHRPPSASSGQSTVHLSESGTRMPHDASEPQALAHAPAHPPFESGADSSTSAHGGAASSSWFESHRGAQPSSSFAGSASVPWTLRGSPRGSTGSETAATAAEADATPATSAQTLELMMREGAESSTASTGVRRLSAGGSGEAYAAAPPPPTLRGSGCVARLPLPLGSDAWSAGGPVGEAAGGGSADGGYRRVAASFEGDLANVDVDLSSNPSAPSPDNAGARASPWRERVALLPDATRPTSSGDSAQTVHRDSRAGRTFSAALRYATSASEPDANAPSTSAIAPVATGAAIGEQHSAGAHSAFLAAAAPGPPWNPPAQLQPPSSSESGSTATSGGPSSHSATRRKLKSTAAERDDALAGKWVWSASTVRYGCPGTGLCARVCICAQKVQKDSDEEIVAPTSGLRRRVHDLALEIRSGNAKACFRYTKMLHIKDKYVLENRTGGFLQARLSSWFHHTCRLGVPSLLCNVISMPLSPKSVVCLWHCLLCSGPGRVPDKCHLPLPLTPPVAQTAIKQHVAAAGDSVATASARAAGQAEGLTRPRHALRPRPPRRVHARRRRARAPLLGRRHAAAPGGRAPRRQRARGVAVVGGLRGERRGGLLWPAYAPRERRVRTGRPDGHRTSALCSTCRPGLLHNSCSMHLDLPAAHSCCLAFCGGPQQ
jgi:hypothetical protein